MYIVSIAFIILLIAKGYSAGVRTTYKRSSRVRDIIVFRLPIATRGVMGLYKMFPNPY